MAKLAMLTFALVLAGPLAGQLPGSPQYGHGASSGPVLPVHLQYQTGMQSCWAACAAMISTYGGTAVTDCVVASHWFGVQCCGNPACDQAEAFQTILTMINYFTGYGGSIIKQPLSFAEVVAEIDYGRPIVMYYSGGQIVGHFVVLYGYDQAQNLYIHDPAWGTFVVPYDTSFGYASPGGTLNWVWSGYGIGLRTTGGGGGGGSSWDGDESCSTSSVARSLPLPLIVLLFAAAVSCFRLHFSRRVR
ncbi:MAG: C39 family peptidase [Planctomycetes bacterium]|nr:C39 family peptidase [Planctomycetota bacterium]MCW8137181.1 C39 family peptidase [Planctomycetota bacterium]